MENFKGIQKIKEIYSNGENIIQHLKSIGNNKLNSIEDILISYDLQTGSYIQDYAKTQDFVNSYCNSLAIQIEKLGTFNSIIEVGVGEATTLGTLLKNFKTQPSHVLGFDISWSRLKFAKEFLNEFNINNVSLFTANLFNIPLLDNSVDIVFTSHSIEPNGGKEEEALKELYRITKKYLVLVEPLFEFANSEGQERMKQNGYVTELHATAQKLNYKIIEHRLFDYAPNPLNPTGIIIIEKNTSDSNDLNLVCPISHTTLQKYNDSLLYSTESFLAYPIIDNIPCLLKENSILASHLMTDFKNYKLENKIVYL